MRRLRQVTTITVISLFAAGALALPVLLVCGNGAAAPADAVDRALDYLRGRQQPDGGFAEPGLRSSEQLTAWAVCAIAAAGEDPGTWKSSGRSPLDYLLSGAGDWSQLADIERNCLAICCAGGDPRSFGGIDLVQKITSKIGGDGRIGDQVNEHCWGVIALAAASEPIPEGCRAWLASRQNIDGGFSFTEGTSSDPDDTGAALQALIAAGEDPGSNVISRALSYLRFCQGADGGFKWQTPTSNVGSTAWAAQGIAAAGGDPSSSEWVKSGKSPVDFLLHMQQPDGHVKYSVDSDSNPAWMTAEAIPAILGRPFPLSASTRETDSRSSPDKASKSAASESADDRETAVPDGVSPIDDLGEETAPGQSTGGKSGDSSDSRDSTGAGSTVEPGSTAAVSGGGSSSIGGAAVEPGGGVLPFVIVCGSYLFCLGAVTVALKLR